MIVRVSVVLIRTVCDDIDVSTIWAEVIIRVKWTVNVKQPMTSWLRRPIRSTTRDLNTISWGITVYLTLMMTSALTKRQDYYHPDDHTLPTYDRAVFNWVSKVMLCLLWFCIRAVFIWVSKVIRVLLWFCFTSLCDWLKNFAPLSRPIRSKTQTNRDLLARVFPRLALVTCICFEFWLVHWVICICCDWLG